MSSYVITFACYKQLCYTKQCINSLLASGVDMSRVIAVDNASKDGTADFISKIGSVKLIKNVENRGCGVAWNQGALEFQSEWTIIMNNDVIVTPGWLEGLIQTGNEFGAGIVSSALIEGDLDYERNEFFSTAYKRMKFHCRYNLPHAICMAIHESVWKKIGYFRPEPKLMGYEDTLFFRAAERANIKMITTGASWIHHFGSITQKRIKEETQLEEKDRLGNRYNYRLLNDTWLTRKYRKILKLKRLNLYRKSELSSSGMTIHGIRANETFNWI